MRLEIMGVPPVRSNDFGIGGKMESCKILLIDDDPTYRAIMREAASSLGGVELKAYGSLVEMGSVCCLGKYDVIIVDYDLGLISGNDIATYLESFFGSSIPMLLISSVPRNDRVKGTSLEHTDFTLKTENYSEVLQKAATLASGSLVSKKTVEKFLSL